MNLPDLERFAEVAATAAGSGISSGLDLRELFRELAEARTRRWIGYLGSASQTTQVRGEIALQNLLQSDGGRRVLQHVLRDCLIGTEAVSLAALSIIAAEVATSGESAFTTRAMRSVDNLSDADAAVFLTILSRPDSAHHLSGGFGACVALDCARIADESWSSLRSIVGFDGEGLYAASNELVTRRMFLPDTALGRLGGGPQTTIIFNVTGISLRFYDLLYRAQLLSDARMHTALRLQTVASTQAVWEPLLQGAASEPDTPSSGAPR